MTAGMQDEGAPTQPLVAAATVATGDRIGRFVVRHTIGAGGMGVVVAAYDPVLDRQVALKVLHDTDDAQLLTEAQAMARVAHPNVVAIYDAGADQGRVYLAMELVDGGTLRAWLATPRRWRDIRDRFVEAGRGLAAAHHAGLAHRDFKPDNVLVGRDGRARVTDFGLVRFASAGAAVGGTPRYMAPEQRAGEPGDARSDQYAFCVALQEALDSLVEDDRPPARVAAAIRRGLATEPGARFAALDDLLAALAHEPSRKPIVIGAAIVAAAAITFAKWPVATPAEAPLVGVALDAPAMADLDRVTALGAVAVRAGLDDRSDWLVTAAASHGLELYAALPGPACEQELRNPDLRTQLRARYRSLAQRYCGRVKHYTFWDSPANCGAESHRRYARWLEDWSQAMREGCTELVLATGSIDCATGDCAAFVAELYRNAAGDSFDAVALHPRGAGSIAGVARVLAEHGHTRPIWLTGLTTDELAVADAHVTVALTAVRFDEARFHDRMVGAGVQLHAMVNAGIELLGEPPEPGAAIPGFGPEGAWELHARFARPHNSALGRRFGYYSAGLPEEVGQTLADRYAPERRYCFTSAAQGGRDDTGVIPYQIGYAGAHGFVALATRTIAVGRAWQVTDGVCHDTGAGGAELGQPIVIRFGSVAAGGEGDVWFDDLRVTSRARGPGVRN